jgi:hypothetical protein
MVKSNAIQNDIKSFVGFFETKGWDYGREFGWSLNNDGFFRINIHNQKYFSITAVTS